MKKPNNDPKQETQEIECILYKIDFERRCLLYKVPAKELEPSPPKEEEKRKLK